MRKNLRAFCAETQGLALPRLGRETAGARFARLLRGRRHIEASFMCRWPRRTAFGRPRPIGKPPPAAWEIFGNITCSRLLTSSLTTSFPVFPCCGAAFPIRRGRPKALRRHGAAGETQFQSAATGLRQMRIAHPPPVFQLRRGSAHAER